MTPPNRSRFDSRPPRNLHLGVRHRQRRASERWRQTDRGARQPPRRCPSGCSGPGPPTCPPSTTRSRTRRPTQSRKGRSSPGKSSTGGSGTIASTRARAGRERRREKARRHGRIHMHRVVHPRRPTSWCERWSTRGNGSVEVELANASPWSDGLPSTLRLWRMKCMSQSLGAVDTPVAGFPKVEHAEGPREPCEQPRSRRLLPGAGQREPDGAQSRTRRTTSRRARPTRRSARRSDGRARRLVRCARRSR